MHIPQAGAILDWSALGPRFAALLHEDLTPERVPDWLVRWSDLQKIVWETRAGLKRDRLCDLTDEAAGRAWGRFVEEVFAPFQVANGALTTKLLAVPGYAPAPERVQMLRQFRAAEGIVSAENAAIEADISALAGEYGTLAASMTATIDGREVTGPELDRRARDQDRAVREAAWRAGNTPWLERRGAIDKLFLALLARRRRLARNAGLPDYRAYRWRELGRLDYTPADCRAFHEAIAAEIVPLAARRQGARRERLGVGTLRPWDLAAPPDFRPRPQPFPDVTAFEEGMARVFARVDPELGALFGRMRRGFLDLGWRKGKSGGGEEWTFPVTGLPYVLLNKDGTDEGVSFLLHEMGHAFHDYLVLARRGLIWESNYPDEFAEFAAIALTYLAAPALARDRGGPYSAEDAARTGALALEEAVVKWLPLIALTDAFQHWLYAEAPEDAAPADLDAQWAALSARFMPWVDWDGLAAEQATGWQHVGLLFSQPFYYIEYGLAHLGALQVWRRAQADPAAAWRDYRAALALGATQSLPDLFDAAGARLPFDRAVVREVAQSLADHLDRHPA